MCYCKICRAYICDFNIYTYITYIVFFLNIILFLNFSIQYYILNIYTFYYMSGIIFHILNNLWHGHQTIKFETGKKQQVKPSKCLPPGVSTECYTISIKIVILHYRNSFYTPANILIFKLSFHYTNEPADEQNSLMVLSGSFSRYTFISHQKIFPNLEVIVLSSSKKLIIWSFTFKTQSIIN